MASPQRCPDATLSGVVHPRRRTDALSALDVTYPEVGGTAATALPAGYRHVERSVVVGEGAQTLRRATSALLTWSVHRAAGMTVTGPPAVTAGATVVLTVGRRPFRVDAPCRVLSVTDLPDRGGFVYGTLPGHPETGEEAFLVRLAPDGRVMFTVRAFSRPATWWARLGRPVSGAVQDGLTRRYLTSLRTLARSSPADGGGAVG